MEMNKEQIEFLKALFNSESDLDKLVYNGFKKKLSKDIIRFIEHI